MSTGGVSEVVFPGNVWAQHGRIFSAETVPRERGWLCEFLGDEIAGGL